MSLKVYIDTNVYLNSIENRDSEFKDFEDGVQYFCARRVEADLIITSNKKDFTHSEIEVLTPLTFFNEYMK